MADRLESRRAVCGKQTKNGGAARANLSRFAPCRLPAGHQDDCDAGPAPERPAPKAA